MSKAILTAKTDVRKLMFSMKRCLRYDAGADDRRYLSALAEYLASQDAKLAFFGTGELCQYFLNMAPQLKASVSIIVPHNADTQAESVGGIPVSDSKAIGPDIKTVFLSSTNWREISRMKKKLPPGIKAVTLDALVDVNMDVVPSRAWVPRLESIYPIDIPEIEFLPDQDLILLDFPARSLGQMPVGFGYVHDALKKERIKFQTMDLDIILYHGYHSDRVLDGLQVMRTPSGRALPDDPWLPVHYLEWEKTDLIDFFRPQIDEVVEKLCKAKPKILACSLQQANLMFAKEVVSAVRKLYPEVIVVVGGMSCLQPGAARTLFPAADYTVVGEADLCIGPLVKALLAGEKPRDIAGIWSRYDTQGRVFTPGRLPEDLDALGHPRYEWTDLQLYRNWNGYSLTPIVGSRGCSWSRCRFCAERFNWRIRTPEKIVDDLEFFTKHGFVEFVFNESDLHGNPETVNKMCEEIIRRKLNVRMTAQLRCNKKTDKKYFKTLAKAGFTCLRFGVDAGSENVLKLQMKGSTKDIIRRSLKDATEAGIYTEINIVVGIPGETEADIDETIEFFTELKPYIGRVAFINPLMLFRGSEYWENSDVYGIKFKVSKDELYEKYTVAIPDSLWYSVNPDIDTETRYRRFQRVSRALRENGVPTGEWADFTTDEVMKKDTDIAGLHNCSGLDEGKTSEASEDDATAGRDDEAQPVAAPDPGETVVDTETSSPWVPVFLYVHKEYNLVRFRGFIYAIPTAYGKIDFADEKDRTQPGVIIGEDEMQVKRAIEGVLQAQENSHSYFLFPYKEHLLGISRNKEANTVLDLKHEPGPSTALPELIGSSDGFNIVSYDDFFYAVPISLGPLDLTRKEHREKLGIIVAFTESEVRKHIENNRQGT